MNKEYRAIEDSMRMLISWFASLWEQVWSKRAGGGEGGKGVRGELVNQGVLLYCRPLSFLLCS